jgi:hypothetical protein
MSATGGRSHHRVGALSDKKVPQLRAMAKRMKVKQTRADGAHKTKAQLIRSIHQASHGAHGGASKSHHKKKHGHKSARKGHKSHRSHKKRHH